MALTVLCVPLLLNSGRGIRGGRTSPPVAATGHAVGSGFPYRPLWQGTASPVTDCQAAPPSVFVRGAKRGSATFSRDTGHTGQGKRVARQRVCNPRAPVLRNSHQTRAIQGHRQYSTLFRKPVQPRVVSNTLQEYLTNKNLPPPLGREGGREGAHRINVGSIDAVLERAPRLQTRQSVQTRLKSSRPRFAPARPKVCTSHVREPLRFPKQNLRV